MVRLATSAETIIYTHNNIELVLFEHPLKLAAMSEFPSFDHKIGHAVHSGVREVLCFTKS